MLASINQYFNYPPEIFNEIVVAKLRKPIYPLMLLNDNKNLLQILSYNS